MERGRKDIGVCEDWREEMCLEERERLRGRNKSRESRQQKKVICCCKIKGRKDKRLRCIDRRESERERERER